MSCELKHVEMPDEVRLCVGFRIGEAVADAGLRAEMHDPVEVGGSSQFFQRACVREVELIEAEAIAEIGAQPIEPGALQRRIVIIVEIIDADDLLAPRQKRASGRRANEASHPRDENRHASDLAGAKAVRRMKNCAPQSGQVTGRPSWLPGGG